MHNLLFTLKSSVPNSMVVLLWLYHLRSIAVCNTHSRFSSLMSSPPARSCSEFTVPEVLLPLQSTATQHPVLYCRVNKKEKKLAVLYSTARMSDSCSLPILFPHQLFQASARGRTCCSLPASTVATVAYGPLCLWRLNAFGTCHRCKSLLHHLFQCIDNSKKVTV